MNRRFSSPFANIESREQAMSMARYSVAGFGLWVLVVLVQAGLVWWTPDRADSAGSTLGFLVFQAIIAGMAALFQWRKPNRILPVFGVAWNLFEVSSLMVGLMVGMPMAVSGLPAWAAALTTGVMMVCVILHIGGLRGTVALSRFS
ncbi:hypothetical protein GCM10009093_18830 [Brevundimonas terrae]|uniref:Uncharacterized protein n=1 Tax=Brevundimonas terrae TaxID=363631 RepID=A0ABP3I6Z6_9CAUL|nr:hypothetical protein [Brevundimonas terrae]NIJ26624.1 hypothetical protein [Brevundimonas terrae]